MAVIVAIHGMPSRSLRSLWADLAKAGSDVAPHDQIVAATAVSLGWRVATANLRHCERIPGLDVVEVRWRGI